MFFFEQKLQSQCGKLCRKYPNVSDNIKVKLQEVEQNWERLEDLAQTRKTKLEESYQLNRFLAASNEHVSTSSKIVRALISIIFVLFLLFVLDQVVSEPHQSDGVGRACKGHGRRGEPH